jgi:hypothetical protein
MTAEIDIREVLWSDTKSLLNLDPDSVRGYWSRLIESMVLLDSCSDKPLKALTSAILKDLSLDTSGNYDIEDLERAMFRRPYTHIFETTRGDISKFSVLKCLRPIKSYILARLDEIRPEITFSAMGNKQQVSSKWIQ